MVSHAGHTGVTQGMYVRACVCEAHAVVIGHSLLVLVLVLVIALITPFFSSSCSRATPPTINGNPPTKYGTIPIKFHLPSHSSTPHHITAWCTPPVPHHFPPHTPLRCMKPADPLADPSQAQLPGRVVHLSKGDGLAGDTGGGLTYCRCCARGGGGGAAWCCVSLCSSRDGGREGMYVATLCCGSRGEGGAAAE